MMTLHMLTFHWMPVALSKKAVQDVFRCYNETKDPNARNSICW